jgi:hypothetical protein
MYYKKGTLPKKMYLTPTQAEFYMELIFDLIFDLIWWNQMVHILLLHKQNSIVFVILISNKIYTTVD